MKFLTSLRQRIRAFLAGALVLACAAAILLLRRIKRLLSLARRFWPALACALLLVCAAVLLTGGRRTEAMASRIGRGPCPPGGGRPGLGQLGILDPGGGSFVLWEMEDRGT